MEFEVIVFRQVPFEILFQAHVPEVVMLSLFGDLEGRPAEQVITEILDKLSSLIAEKSKLQQLLRQLEVLSKLRKLRLLTVKLIKAMPYDWEYDLIKDDRLYLKGIEKGIEKGIKEEAAKFVAYLLDEGKHSVEQIAAIADVPVEFVLNFQKQREQKSNGNRNGKKN